MTREDRSEAFWLAVSSHPEVLGAVQGLDPAFVCRMVQSPKVRPFATAHGGFLLTSYDDLGSVMGLHALYTPEGWGREAHGALTEALEWAFATAQVVLVHETGNPNSRAALSFGFRPAGDWQDTLAGPIRVCVLTRMAWEQSPAHRRLHRLN